jgi:predicted enzyme related to lactoylglutathione lyase
MRHVTGIGGVFFPANDPKALAAWYRDHLGIDLAPADYDAQPWSQEAGPTIFAPFPADKWKKGGKGFRLNFRVRDLDGLVSSLRAAGIDVEVDPQTYPNGRFAKLVDPEGHAIELWEPGGVAAPKR